MCKDKEWLLTQYEFFDASRDDQNERKPAHKYYSCMAIRKIEK